MRCTPFGSTCIRMRRMNASLNAIAAKLNERNVPMARGGRWTHVQVGAVLRPFADGAVGVVV